MMSICSTGLGDSPKTPGAGTVLAAKWGDRSAFNVEEIAEILGLSRWAAYEAVRRKEIASVRIGRRLIIPRHWLERKLAEVGV
jgi:excisionase family DNA binding protein